MKTKSKFAVSVAGFVLLGLMAGCATSTKPKAKGYTFFPPAPDEPRLQYLTSFSSDIDLGRSSAFTDFVTGKRSSPNELARPYGVSSQAGKILVCDTGASTVQVFDLKRRRAHFFNSRGEGKLRMPINVSLDQDGTRYVTDTSREQVVIFNPEDGYLGAIGVKDEMKPCDVAISGDRLYVADLKGHAVRVYNKVDRKLLFTIPRDPQAKEGKLFSPTNLAIDSGGRLVVTDTGASVVQVYDLDGKYLRTIGGQGLGFGRFSRPKGVAVDRAGLIYVVDAATQLVQIFDSEGKLLLFFGQPGATTQGELILPAGITIDYENVGYFQKYLAPGQQCDYLVLVTSQFGSHKVNVYGFLKKEAKAP